MTTPVEIRFAAVKPVTLVAGLEANDELSYDVATGRISFPARREVFDGVSRALEAGELVPTSGPLDPTALLIAFQEHAQHLEPGPRGAAYLGVVDLYVASESTPREPHQGEHPPGGSSDPSSLPPSPDAAKGE